MIEGRKGQKRISPLGLWVQLQGLARITIVKSGSKAPALQISRKSFLDKPLRSVYETEHFLQLFPIGDLTGVLNRKSQGGSRRKSARKGGGVVGIHLFC
jgi:hypothetical protein